MALLCVLERVLIGRTSNTDCLSSHCGAGCFEGLHCRLGVARLALTYSGKALIELVLAAEQTASGNTNVFEHDLGGVAGLDAVLLVLLTLRQSGGVRWNDETCVSLGAELWVDNGDYDVDVCNTAIGDPCLGAVEDPFVLGFVVDGAQSVSTDVRTSIGLRRTEGSECNVVGVAIALGNPFKHLLFRTGGGDARGSEPRAHDGHGQTGVAPKQLLDGDHHGEVGGVVHHHLGHELPAVEADLRGFLDDRVRKLFLFVPFLTIGAHDIFGEAVNPLLELKLIFVECERKVGH